MLKDSIQNSVIKSTKSKKGSSLAESKPLTSRPQSQSLQHKDEQVLPRDHEEELQVSLEEINENEFLNQKHNDRFRVQSSHSSFETHSGNSQRSRGAISGASKMIFIDERSQEVPDLKFEADLRNHIASSSSSELSMVEYQSSEGSDVSSSCHEDPGLEHEQCKHLGEKSLFQNIDNIIKLYNKEVILFNEDHTMPHASQIQS